MNRLWISLRYEQMKRLSPAIGFIMQSATLSGVLYGLLAWHFSQPLFLFPVFFFGTLGLGFGMAWLYYDVLGMRHAEQQARFNMEPQYTHILAPQTAWMLGCLARALEGDKAAIEELKTASTCQHVQALMHDSVQQVLYPPDDSGDLPEEDGQPEPEPNAQERLDLLERNRQVLAQQSRRIP